MSAMSAMWMLVKTQIALYLGNRRALIINLLVPIAIASFFGAIFSPNSKGSVTVAVAVVDLDQSDVSKALVNGLSKEKMLKVMRLTPTEAETKVRNGDLSASLTIPKGFGEAAPRSLLTQANAPSVQVDYDPSQTLAMNVLEGMLAMHTMDAVIGQAMNTTSALSLIKEGREGLEKAPGLDVGQRTALRALYDSTEHLVNEMEKARAGKAPEQQAAAANGPHFKLPYTVKERALTAQPGAEYNGYAHSFGGMGVQFILFMGIDLGVGILLARRLGLWQRLRAAPLSRGVLLGSYIVSTTLIATVNFALIMTVAVLGFGVQIGGSVFGLAVVLLSFGLFTASFGLMLASIGGNPEASRGLAIFISLLLVMLGGAWVPSFIFPPWLQQATLWVPTRWAVDAIDAMTWRGLGNSAALTASGVLLAFGLVLAALAWWRFRWHE